jgi:hypothetical protein
MHWISGAAGIAICLWGMTQANAGAWVTLLGLGVGGVFLFGIAALGRGLRQAPASI